MLQEQRIGVEEYEALCKGTRNLTPPPITDELSRWVNETQWSALQPLTQLQVSIAVFHLLHGANACMKTPTYCHQSFPAFNKAVRALTKRECRLVINVLDIQSLPIAIRKFHIIVFIFLGIWHTGKGHGEEQ